MEKLVFVSTSLVGEGNPATALAVGNLIEKAGHAVERGLLNLSAIPARLFHRSMRTSRHLGQEYTDHSEGLRRLAIPVLGALSKIEHSLRFRQMFTPTKSPRMLVAVQEHQLGGYSEEKLKKSFPGGRFLVIPDVEPKDSAVKLMRDLGITPIVWNEQAQVRLTDLGFDPKLVAPFLPKGFMNGYSDLGPLSPRIVVKTSGSGISPIHRDNLRQALDVLGIEYKIYLPGEVLSQGQKVKRVGPLSKRISEFYDDIVSQPPTLLISPPSEMIQVGSVLLQRGTSLCPLPPNGAHERVNLEWAERMGLCQKLLNPDDNMLISRISHQFGASKSPRICDGIGTTSIVEALGLR
ncbi:MAG: hypothetical protein Q7S88_00985 [Candidatus Daviesbacteria bacterium]|nr:hypothetical protein [Candidatus Daviesbacteria bacterium]